MDEQPISTVTRRDQRTDAEAEGENRSQPEPSHGQPEPNRGQAEPQPKRLLGELSRASESLAEVLDALTAEKRELEARLERIEGELERARAEAVTAKSEAAAAVERARKDASAQLERARSETENAKKEAVEAVERTRDEKAAELASAARTAARNQARAERAERLLATVGALRETATFSVTVGRFARKQASREMLAQAVTDDVHLRLSGHHGWSDSLLVADVEGDPGAVQRFLTWARSRFADDELRERQT
jgi:hypothetical protein